MTFCKKDAIREPPFFGGHLSAALLFMTEKNIGHFVNGSVTSAAGAYIDINHLYNDLCLHIALLVTLVE